MRPTRDNYYMGMARAASERSTCSRLHVGCVVVSDDSIVGVGYNGAPKGVEHCIHTDDSPCRVSVHAEVNALLHASNTKGSVLYITHLPCFECSKLIVNAQVQHVIYAEEYRSKEGLDILTSGGVLYRRL